MSLIEVKGLRKSFGRLEVLKGVDLTVEQGERIANIDCGGAAYNPFEQAEEDVLSVTILKNMSKRLEYRWENDRNIIDTAL